MADQPAEAKRVADGLLKRKPNFALKYMEEWMPFKDPADRERILSAAEKGGLPRQPPLG